MFAALSLALIWWSDIFLESTLPYKVVINFDVFGAGIKDWIISQSHGGFLRNDGWRVLECNMQNPVEFMKSYDVGCCNGKGSIHSFDGGYCHGWLFYDTP